MKNQSNIFRGKVTTVLVIVSVMVTTTTQQVHAAPGLISVTSPLTFNGGNYCLGWEFNTSIPQTITSLGAFDKDGDGLLVPHSVGIWRVSDNALMVSTTISGGTSSTLVGSFRYESVSSTALAPGNYIVGAVYPNFQDDYLYDCGGYTLDAGLTWVRGRFQNGATFTYPVLIDPTQTGAFSANFNGLGSVAAPEPASLSLLVLGGLGSIGFRIRQKRNK
jgi:hypothetical protein